MDPYASPPPLPCPDLGIPTQEINVHRGHQCRICGSLDTSAESILRPAPSIVLAYFFNLLYVLLRTALRVKSELCYQCGTVRRYKTAGSWIAWACLLLYVALSILAWLLPYTAIGQAAAARHHSISKHRR
jgi:hypothetical protein